MTALIELREELKSFYAKYEYYILPVIKFLMALVTLVIINSNIGYMSVLKNPALTLMLALACSFLPSNTILLFAAIYIVLHFYQVSLLVAVIALALILIMFLLYYRLSSKETYYVILIPLAYVLKIPYAVPIVAGLLGSPLSAVPVSFGVIIYYLMETVKQNTAIMSNSEASNMVQTYTYLIDSLVNNNIMLLTILAFSATVIVVNIIRKLSVDYAWSIAIVIGAITDILVLLVGDYMMNITGNIVSLLLGSIVSVLIALAVNFFAFDLDYTRTEHVKFEDDEYYYYVKAVPKINITSKDRKVKKINSQRNMMRRTNLPRKDEKETEDELKILK